MPVDQTEHDLRELPSPQLPQSLEYHFPSLESLVLDNYPFRFGTVHTIPSTLTHLEVRGTELRSPLSLQSISIANLLVSL